MNFSRIDVGAIDCKIETNSSIKENSIKKKVSAIAFEPIFQRYPSINHWNLPYTMKEEDSERSNREI